jgi:hypothetical protein
VFADDILERLDMNETSREHGNHSKITNFNISGKQTNSDDEEIPIKSKIPKLNLA